MQRLQKGDKKVGYAPPFQLIIRLKLLSYYSGLHASAQNVPALAAQTLLPPQVNQVVLAEFIGQLAQHLHVLAVPQFHDTAHPYPSAFLLVLVHFLAKERVTRITVCEHAH